MKVANRSGSDPRNLISGVSWWNPRNPWCNDHWGGSAGKSIGLFTSFHKKSIEISKSLQFLRRNLSDSKGNPLFFVSSQTEVSLPGVSDSSWAPKKSFATHSGGQKNSGTAVICTWPRRSRNGFGQIVIIQYNSLT